MSRARDILPEAYEAWAGVAWSFGRAAGFVGLPLMVEMTRELSRDARVAFEPMRTGVAVLVAVAAFSVGGCRRSPACDASDPVSLELCGPRKDWVGQWVEDSSPPRYIDIGPHGGYRFLDARPHHQRLVEGDIVAFVGNDMKVRTNDDRAEELVLLVTDPPHEAGGSWSMTVQGTTYHR